MPTVTKPYVRPSEAVRLRRLQESRASAPDGPRRERRKIKAGRGNADAQGNQAESPWNNVPTNDVDYAYYENGLRIDKLSLDECVSEQPSLMHDVSDRYALAVSLRDQAKDDLKTLEASVRLRLKAQLKDGDKLTQSELDARVQVHAERKQAFTSYVKAEEEVNRWEGLKDSYKQRSYLLRDMVNMHLSSYFAEDSERGAGFDRGRIMGAEYEANKALLAQGRRERAERKGRH